MKAEEYLEIIPVLSRRVRMNHDSLIRLRESLDITGVSYDSIGAAPGTRNNDVMGEMIGKVVDFETELRADERKLANMVINATTAINKLESEAQREILTRWYLRSEKLTEIMEKTSYSRSRVYALKKKGLENLPDFESQDEIRQNKTE